MKAVAVIFALILTIAIGYAIVSGWYSAFVLGGMLWRATPWQLLVENAPYLLGIFLLVGIWLGVFNLFKTRK